ncbi:class IIb bacteriocin, lactobin A/cerein 7B family [Pedobacter sp. R-06]|uniref:class IIb bacteriocin, lactobin A/cerein 7B family n=1 Tax=Pedobacter sp. R-06 TaxID=3404051 RepID=UPI003CE96095
MKNLKLESFGVQELDAKEMEEMNGGILPLLAAAVGICAGAYVISYGAGKAYYYLTH